jgi:hypothetical protein
MHWRPMDRTDTAPPAADAGSLRAACRCGAAALCGRGGVGAQRADERRSRRDLLRPRCRRGRCGDVARVDGRIGRHRVDDCGIVRETALWGVASDRWTGGAFGGGARCSRGSCGRRLAVVCAARLEDDTGGRESVVGLRRCGRPASPGRRLGAGYGPVAGPDDPADRTSAAPFARGRPAHLPDRGRGGGGGRRVLAGDRGCGRGRTAAQLVLHPAVPHVHHRRTGQLAGATVVRRRRRRRVERRAPRRPSSPAGGSCARGGRSLVDTCSHCARS